MRLRKRYNCVECAVIMRVLMTQDREFAFCESVGYHKGIMITQHVADVDTLQKQLPVFLKKIQSDKQSVMIMGKRSPMGFVVSVDEYKRYQEWRQETSDIEEQAKKNYNLKVIQQEASSLREELKQEWKGKNRDISMSQEEIDALNY